MFAQLNAAVCSFVSNLAASFPDDVALSTNARTLKQCVAANSATKQVFEQLKVGVVDAEAVVIDAINNKDADAFFSASTAPLVIYSGNKKLYDQMSGDEQQAFWKSLKSIILLIAVVNSTGDSLASYQALAAKFVENNKGLDPEQSQATIFSQILTNPELSSTLLSAYKDKSSIKSILGSVSTIVKAIGIQEAVETSKKKTEPKKTQEVGKEEESTTTTTTTTELGFAPTTVASAVQEEVVDEEEEGEEKKADLAAVLSMFNDIEIDDDDLTAVHEGVTDVLSGKPLKIDEDTSIDLKGILAGLGSGGGAAGMMSMLSDIMQKTQSTTTTTTESAEKEASGEHRSREDVAELMQGMQTMMSSLETATSSLQESAAAAAVSAPPVKT